MRDGAIGRTILAVHGHSTTIIPIDDAGPQIAAATVVEVERAAVGEETHQLRDRAITVKVSRVTRHSAHVPYARLMPSPSPTVCSAL